MKINGIINPNILGDISNKKNKQEAETSFSNVLKGIVEDANNLQKDANLKTQNFVSGKIDNIQEVMVAGQKAEIAMSFVIEVRNKLLDAYQEFSRMQV
ncbi:flagellar hook-basal body complex protein FliE [Haliovirga abyssi]|uniref:Flagellar hook-basal body complex protein FliE n=1 Tax=Haliovirga abyssi TaxID=2996794 RepID=A0AAU9DB05_9FUSO|nr:flagellar hook-basal body complex protein FliE [Haliovirga abyssi]BDU50485.1 hypothetical protein HLVA_10540 [Haliovirga abyssi]